MTAPLRRAGTGIDASGQLVVWSVAEGRRGRRWREARVVDGRIASSLLLETFPDRRFSHTELSTPSGLLTLHPEPDGTVHGNTVTEAGVGHIVGLPFERNGVFLVEGSVVAVVVAVHLLADVLAPGADASVRAIVVGPELRVSSRDVPVSRTPDGSWQIGQEAPIALDPLGLPVLREGRSWPLELG